MTSIINSKKSKGNPATVNTVSASTLQDDEDIVSMNRDEIMPTMKFYPNKVQPNWYRRYKNILPEEERLEYQPWLEIEKREEEVAVQAVFGVDINSVKDERIKLQRVHSAKRRMELLRTSYYSPYQNIHNLMRMSANYKLRQADIRQESESLYPFGLSESEKGKIDPLVKYIARKRILHKYKMRNERQGKPRNYKSPIWKRLQSPHILLGLIELGKRARKERLLKAFFNIGRKIMLLIKVKKMLETICETGKVFAKILAGAAGSTIGHVSKGHLTLEAELTLTKHWLARSDSEIKQATFELRRHRCFSKLPLQVQKRFASVAWYMSVPKDTTILRQGQESFDMYFLLTGRVDVAVLRSNPLDDNCIFEQLTTHPADTLFGTESFTRPGCLREYSAVTTMPSTLLSVNIHELQNFILTPSRTEPAPKHIMFIGRLDFMKRFPKIILTSEAFENIFLVYFSPSDLIVKSVRDSDFVYVVIYGTCRAIAEMKPKHYLDQLENRGSRPNTPENGTRVTVGKGKLLINSMRELSYDQRQKKKLGGLYPPHTFDRARASAVVRTVTKKFEKSDGEARANQQHTMRNSNLLLPRRTIARKTILPSIGENQGMTRASQGVSQVVNQDMRSSVATSVDSESTKTTLKLQRYSTAHDHEFEKEVLKDFDFAQKTGQKKIKELLEHRKSSEAYPGPENVNHTNITGKGESFRPRLYSKWKLIKVLNKGDSMGHDWINFNDGKFCPPSEDASLVSDGCEIVMIRKTVLVDNMANPP